jgi:Fe-Mn family superoxide dismutase
LALKEEVLMPIQTVEGEISRRNFILSAAGGIVLLGAGMAGLSGCDSRTGGAATVALPELPYKENALEPYISRKTIGFHHGKHHGAYVDRTLELIKGTPLAGLSLKDIVQKTSGFADKASTFNNAAQSWNHDFYWKSLAPGGGGKPEGEMARRLDAAFGSYENFKKELTSAAMSQFGSGWAWLVVEEDRLKVVNTSNAETPIIHGQVPLLTIDVWEHAYYLDYQNLRSDYVKNVIEHLINWKFAESNLPVA